MNIAKRHIFYIPGYEPRGPSFYEKLFFKHLGRYLRLAKQTLVSRETKVTELYRRTVCKVDGLDSCAQLSYDILDNAEVLRPHNDIPRWKFYLLLIFYTPKALLSALRPTCRNVSHGWLVLLLAWLVFYLGLLLIFLFYQLAQLLFISMHLPPLIATMASVIVAIGLCYYFDRQYHEKNIARMFNSGRFFLNGSDPIQAQMSARLDQFAEFIEAEILAGESDEYVLVGHSSGSVLAARVAAKLVDSPKLKNKGFDLVCMGSVYQLELSGQTHIDTRKQVYQRLRDADNLNWTEVFAAFDAFCPQRMNPCDPKLVPTAGVKPFFKSANLRANLSPVKLAKLRKNFFWIHMQYILSSDYALTFDYFKLVTGKSSTYQYLKSSGQAESSPSPSRPPQPSAER